MDSHQTVQEEQLPTADLEQERSTARTKQYFLECFWAEVLGFTTEEGNVANPKPRSRLAPVAVGFTPGSSNKHSGAFLLVFTEPMVFAQPQPCSH